MEVEGLPCTEWLLQEKHEKITRNLQKAPMELLPRGTFHLLKC